MQQKEKITCVTRCVYDENVGRNFSIQPIKPANEGVVSIAITNLVEQAIEANLSLGKASTMRPFDNGVEHFSNWLLIISAPIFCLGIWLLVPKQKKDAAAASSESRIWKKERRGPLDLGACLHVPASPDRLAEASIAVHWFVFELYL